MIELPRAVGFGREEVIPNERSGMKKKRIYFSAGQDLLDSGGMIDL